MLSGLGVVTWVLLVGQYSDHRNNLAGEETDSFAAEAQKVLTCDQRKLLALGALGSQRESGETEVVLNRTYRGVIALEKKIEMARLIPAIFT